MRPEGLLYRAVSGKENSITELFVNLMQWRFLRNIILSEFELNEEHRNTISYSDIRTQVRYGNGKNGYIIPDIVIENDTVYLLIEVKTDSYLGFRRSQQEMDLEESNSAKTYLDIVKEKYIENGKKRHLCSMVYLIPRNHIEFKKINNEKDSSVKIVFWEDILAHIENEDVTKGSKLVEESVRFITNKIVKTESITELGRSEIVLMANGKDLMNAVNILIKTRKILKDMSSLLVEELSQREGRKWCYDSFQDDSNGWGLYLTDQKDTLFIGFNPIGEEFVFSCAILKESISDLNDPEGIFDEDEEYGFYRLDKYSVPESSETFIKALAEEVHSIRKEKCK